MVMVSALPPPPNSLEITQFSFFQFENALLINTEENTRTVPKTLNGNNGLNDRSE